MYLHLYRYIKSTHTIQNKMRQPKIQPILQVLLAIGRETKARIPKGIGSVDSFIRRTLSTFLLT